MKDGKRLGRPKRVALLSWCDLSALQLDVLRQVNEHKLRSNQLAEVDGEVVCRGVGVSSGDDSDAELVCWDENQIAANFAQALVWDGYGRSVGAAAEMQDQLRRAQEQVVELLKKLADQANEHRRQMSEQELEHHKQLSALLDEVIKFKASLLKTEAPGIDFDKLTEVGLTIADRFIKRG